MSKYSENMPPSLKGAVEWLYDDIKPNTTLLDFGCATGYFGKFLKDNKNCTVFGLEISEDLEEAKKVLDGVYSFDLDGDWPEEIYERKYDYLFYGDVLEHLKYPTEVLKKSKKLLKPEGKIFVSTPNIAHISTRLELMGGNFEYESMGILDSTHLKYFTLNSFSKVAEDAGYRITRVDSSTNDYPKEIVQDMLQKLGLSANEKFWKMASSPEARIYQFKMVLEIGSASKDMKFVPKPIKKPEQYREDTIQDFRNQIEALKKHADEQKKIIEYWDTKSKELLKKEQEVDKILDKRNSAIHRKVARKLRR